MRKPENIFLTGFMGSGKSTIGKQLAAKLKLQFVDTDRLIEKKMRRSISQIFKVDGEKRFRQIEESVVRGTCRDNGQVVALGGGALARASTLARVHRSGILIYLKVPLKLLVRRAQPARRPILAGLTPKERKVEMSRLLRVRAKNYETADLTVLNLDRRITLRRILKFYASR